jgi:hypothetical protein
MKLALAFILGALSMYFGLLLSTGYRLWWRWG